LCGVDGRVLQGLSIHCSLKEGSSQVSIISRVLHSVCLCNSLRIIKKQNTFFFFLLLLLCRKGNPKKKKSGESAIPIGKCE